MRLDVYLVRSGYAETRERAQELIGAGAVVTGKMDAPDGSMILGSPAKVVKEVSPAMMAEIEKDAQLYIALAKAQL